MKNKKTIYIITAVVALTLLISGTTYAATRGQGQNPFTKIAQAIATKFNLNASDVQTVIDETMETERAQRQANREAEQADRLAEAVADGKLTQAQADLITTKRAELQTAIEAMKDLTQDERMAAMKTQTDALKQWATDNNIPMEYVMGRFGVVGPGAGRGMYEPGFGGQGPNANN